MAASATFAKDPRHPQVVSFIGRTGSGKTGLIYRLIQKQESRTGNKQAPQQRVGSHDIGTSDSSIPISWDVCLYADPKTFYDNSPVLYADCGSWFSGERASLKISRSNNSNLPDAVFDTGSKAIQPSESDAASSPKKISRPLQRKAGTSWDVAWAGDDEATQNQDYPVSNISSSMIYTFSDTIVLAVRDSAGRDSSLQWLVDWANLGMEMSVNSSTCPSLVIVMFVADQEEPDAATWYPSALTAELLERMGRKEGKYSIADIQDCLLRQFDGVTVLKTPLGHGPTLPDKQIGRLYSILSKRRYRPYETKRAMRTSPTSEELESNMQAALDQLSRDLNTPFDFLQANHFRSKGDFGSGVLTLLVILLSNQPAEKIINTLRSIAPLMSSCIVLETRRRNVKGKRSVKTYSY